MIACGELRAEVIKAGGSTDGIECRNLFHAEVLFGQTVESGPGAVIMQPMYPVNNRTVVGVYGCFLAFLLPALRIV